LEKWLVGTLVASQSLEAAWQLSHSGTVANRLARVYEKTGACDRALHMYALAAAAGGAATQNSREQVAKLNPAASEKTMSDANVELQKTRVVASPKSAGQKGSAKFALLFDNSSSPDRARFLDGDSALSGQIDALQRTDFPIKFPDVDQNHPAGDGFLRFVSLQVRSSALEFRAAERRSSTCGSTESITLSRIFSRRKEKRERPASFEPAGRPVDCLGLTKGWSL